MAHSLARNHPCQLDHLRWVGMDSNMRLLEQGITVPSTWKPILGLHQFPEFDALEGRGNRYSMVLYKWYDLQL